MLSPAPPVLKMCDNGQFIIKMLFRLGARALMRCAVAYCPQRDATAGAYAPRYEYVGGRGGAAPPFLPRGHMTVSHQFQAQAPSISGTHPDTPRTQETAEALEKVSTHLTPRQSSQ
jgi:hypothetical protein